jgi:hypothetical protein
LNSTPGFRLLIDPFYIDPATREPTFGYWPEDIFDFTLNNNYIIFKAKCRLWNISFDPHSFEKEFPKPFLDLTELCGEDDSYIKKVFGGNSKDGSKICFAIRRDDEEGKNTVVTWDLNKNAEMNQYEIEDPYNISFDLEGNIIIINESDGQYVISIDERSTKITAFEFDAHLLEEHNAKEKQVDEEQLGAGLFDFSRGCRFNFKGHDSLMFDNYFSLSYSYMSFVAKDMIERGHPSLASNEFDLTPYNYLFNQRTSFTDGTASLHISTLKEILEKFGEYGPEMLSILTYTRPISKENRMSNDGENSD